MTCDMASGFNFIHIKTLPVHFLVRWSSGSPPGLQPLVLMLFSGISSITAAVHSAYWALRYSKKLLYVGVCARLITLAPCHCFHNANEPYLN